MDATGGDFLLIPRHVIHRESNTGSTPSKEVVTRAGHGPVRRVLLTGRCPTRARLAVAASLFTALTMAAVPAHASSAVVSPDCATTLADVASGMSSSCGTQGPPPVACNGCGVRRTVDVVVTAGSVDATLLCDGLTYRTHVDGPGTGSTGAWGGLNCTLTLTATADGTVAAATSTASYVFIGP